MNKKPYFIIPIIILLSLTVRAETMYLTDNLEVAVRTGKGLEFKILAIVKSNDQFEVLGTEGEYANIKLSNGVEGWILRRYLTSENPKPIVIKNLTSKIEKLQTNRKSMEEEINMLKTTIGDLEETGKVQAEKIGIIEKEYENLRGSSSHYLQLKEEHETLQKKMTRTDGHLSQVIIENEALQKKNNLMWFIAGSSAVLVGFIIGLILQNLRYRRRRQISF